MMVSQNAKSYMAESKIANQGITSTSITSGKWSASSCSFTSGTYKRQGDVVNVELTLKTTSAYSAGTEYTMGTLNSTDFPIRTSFVGISGIGTVTVQNSGIIRCVPYKNASNGSNFYVRIIGIL